MGKIELISEAIEKAERLESKLGTHGFEIGGFTSPKIRHLLNNLGAISTTYLEIGVLRGATFVSAMYGNNMKGLAVDNFSEFNDGTVRTEFLANISKMDNADFIEQDCYTIDYPKDYFDFYNFDGGHSYEQQRDAITVLYPALKDEFILVIDDSDWEQVIAGTIDGLNQVKANILFEKRFSGADGYHNGTYLALIKK